MQKTKTMQAIQNTKTTLPKRIFSVLSALQVEYLPEKVYGYMTPDLYAPSALPSSCINETSANPLGNSFSQKEKRYG